MDQLLSAAFSLLGELLGHQRGTETSSQVVDTVKKRLLDSMETDDQGRPRLTITLPDASSLDGMARTLAQLLYAGN